MRQLLSKKLGALVLAFGLIASAPAFAIGLDPAFDGPAFGPAPPQRRCIPPGTASTTIDNNLPITSTMPWAPTGSTFALANSRSAHAG